MDGVTFPEGTEFRKIYKHKEYRAEVRAGALCHDGIAYKSPSAVAKAITGTNVNGWSWWESRMPGQADWRLIDELRPRE